MKIDTAHLLARASKVIYNGEEEVNDWATASGFNDVQFFDVAGTQACTITDDYRCILAFRGTSEVGDWLTDLDLRYVPGPYGQVHQGFNEALDMVWDDVKDVFDWPSLYVTGHSLGAALATLAVARLGRGKLYTFGSPKVGDAEFAKEFDSVHHTYRFVNNNDIVARIPLTGYEHIGSLRYFTHKGKMWAKPNKMWLTWDRLCGRVNNKIGDGVEDHSIDDYIRLVGKQTVHASWSGVAW